MSHCFAARSLRALVASFIALAVMGAAASARAEKYPLKVLSGHSEQVNTIAFAGSRTLISGGNDKSIRVWDLAKGKEVRVLMLEREVVTVEVSPDGKQVAAAVGPTGAQPRIEIWDVATGRSIKQSPPLGDPKELIETIRFAPDGKSLAITQLESKQAWLWTPTTDSVETIDIETTGATPRAAFTPDGRTLAIVTGATRISLFGPPEKVGDKRKVETKRCGAIVYGLMFTKDGKSVLVAGQDLETKKPAVEFRDLATWKLDRRIDGGGGFTEFAYLSSALSPDERLFAGGAGFGVQLWDVEKRKRLASIDNKIEIIERGSRDLSQAGAGDVTFSPDGKILAATHSDKIVYWFVSNLPKP